LLLAVATGGPRIDSVNSAYVTQRQELRTYFEALGLEDPIPFDDLWAWYGRWSSGDLPSYQSRRQFLAELLAPAFEQLRAIEAGREVVEERPPTGWTRVDRGIEKMRGALELGDPVQGDLVWTNRSEFGVVLLVPTEGPLGSSVSIQVPPGPGEPVVTLAHNKLLNLFSWSEILDTPGAAELESRLPSGDEKVKRERVRRGIPRHRGGTLRRKRAR
jgi:hypothetical protein